MTRLFLILCLALFSSLATAQPGPLLEVDMPETETLPGQPLTLRITVLVPTWIPHPPVWPSFEAPNLMVRLPERASTSVSRTIEGDTWSGISRRYQITPMVPGTVRLPAQTLIVTYADPGKPDPIRAELSIEPLAVTGLLPEGAEDLDPFVAAHTLTLQQTIKGDTQGMQPGDSFSRIVQADTDGLSGVFLPDLTPQDPLAGLRAYPESPVFEDKETRGQVSGMRSETVVYLAEGRVDGELPGVSIDWYNISTGQIETATADPIPVQATAPPAAPEPLDWRRIAAITALLLLAALVLIWLIRRVTPPLRRWRTAKHERYLKSARYARKRLRQAQKSRDLAATRAAFSIWRARINPLDTDISVRIEAAFAGIGAARYGRPQQTDEEPYWQSLSGLFHLAERANTRRVPLQRSLPGLNPISQTRH